MVRGPGRVDPAGSWTDQGRRGACPITALEVTPGRGIPPAFLSALAIGVWSAVLAPAVLSAVAAVMAAVALVIIVTLVMVAATVPDPAVLRHHGIRGVVPEMFAALRPGIVVTLADRLALLEVGDRCMPVQLAGQRPA
jgi:hypothetical protein